MEDNKLITIEEMADVLRVRPNTLHSKEWRRVNGCPLFRIGRRVYAFRAGFWKWVEQRGVTVSA